MKYIVLIIIFSLTTGYFIYPVINPPADHTQLEMLLRKFLEGEARRYAEADTVDKKLKAADELYGKMMLIFLSELSLKAPEKTTILLPPATAQTSTPVVYVTSNIEPAVKKEAVPSTAQTLPERILNDRLTLKDVATFASFGTLDASDSRIKKLLGNFAGNLTLRSPSRTGSVERIALSVSDQTQLLVQDNYDNISINFSTLTGRAFRGVPGDENLLMINLPENYLFLDLRSYPILTGKLYKEHILEGQFTLKKEARKNP